MTGSSGRSSSSISYEGTNDQRFFAGGQGSSEEDEYDDRDIGEGLHHGQEEEKCNGRSSVVTGTTSPVTGGRHDGGSFMHVGNSNSTLPGKAGKRGLRFGASWGDGVGSKGARSGGSIGGQGGRAKDFDGVFEAGGVRAEELV